MSEPDSDEIIEVTLRASRRVILWAEDFINGWIAEQPPTLWTTGDAHEFVSALTRARMEAHDSQP